MLLFLFSGEQNNLICWINCLLYAMDLFCLFFYTLQGTKSV